VILQWQKALNRYRAFFLLTLLCFFGITSFASIGLTVESPRGAGVDKVQPLLVPSVRYRSPMSSFSTFELDSVYQKIDSFMRKKQHQKAVAAYLDSAAHWHSLVKSSMKLGHDLNDDLDRWESFQIKLARRFMKDGGYREAEDILLDVSKRTPTNPVLTKLLDRLREERLGKGNT